VTRSRQNFVVSIFPERATCDAVEHMVASFGAGWTPMTVSGNEARGLLGEARALLAAIERDPSTADRGPFSKAAVKAIPDVGKADRFFVISPTVCPLELVRDHGRNWGDRAIFSHFHTTAAPSARIVRNALRPRRVPLGTYLLLCPMEMDRALARNLQDIIVVATRLESKCPVDIALQPSYEQALATFARNDVSWLHVDTHGTAESIMLGPSRDSGLMAKPTDLPGRIPVPLVVLVGCQLTSGAASIGSGILRRGPISIWGPCVTFTSLGLAGSDDSQILWYETFFGSLLSGHDIGKSLLLARQALSDDSPLKFTWLILGSSLLCFGKSSDGA
jgi:hypothetical protein